MSEHDLPPLEAFHNTFFYFVEGVNVLASDAVEQRRAIGGPHAAWELQSDVRDSGEAVLRCAGSFLTEAGRSEIASLLNKIANLSIDALRSSDDALDHQDWEHLRSEARHLLEHLARPIADNLAFFSKKKPPAPS